MLCAAALPGRQPNLACGWRPDLYNNSVMASAYKTTVLFLTYSFVVVSAFNSYGQNLATSEPAGLTILTVTVRNKAGNFVMGVPRQSFTLTDEKESRPIEFFQSADQPMSIGLLVDTSASMQFYETRDISRAQPIGETFSHFVELSNPDNEYFVLAFDSAPRVLTSWKTSHDLLSEQISLTPQKKNTALFDSFIAGLEQFKSARYGKRALVVVTDGVDNSSKSTFVQLREQLKRSDVAIYAFVIGTPQDLGSTMGMEGAGIMSEVAEITGGEMKTIHDKTGMKLAVEALSVELKHQYRLGFRGANTGTERWRRLKLKVTPQDNASEEFKKLTATTRQGYYSK